MKDYPQKGVLIAFGELFLKSEGVQRIFKKILVQNISFFLGKEKVNFKIQNFRQRIFIQTSQTQKALKVLKSISGISWLASCLFFPKAGLKEISAFINENYKDWVKKDETFAIRLKLDKDILKEDRDEVIEKIALKFDYFERYAWDQPDFIINPSSTDFSQSEFLTKLCGFLKNQLHRRPQLHVINTTKVAQPASIKQLLDVRSRKILSEFLAEKTQHPKQKELLKIRRDLLRKNPGNLEETEQLLQDFHKILEIKVKEV